MDGRLTGGCACGALRYSISSAPIQQTHCQCRDCQRRSGTGHASWPVFAAAPKDAVVGHASHWTSVGDSGTEKRHGFCPNCGTPVYLAFPVMPGLMAVTAASLDDPARFHPRQITWTSAAQAWDSLPGGLHPYPKMPPTP